LKTVVLRKRDATFHLVWRQPQPATARSDTRPGVLPGQGCYQARGVTRPRVLPARGVTRPGCYQAPGVTSLGVLPGRGVTRPGVLPGPGCYQPGVLPGRGVTRPRVLPGPGCYQAGVLPGRAGVLPGLACYQAWGVTRPWGSESRVNFFQRRPNSMFTRNGKSPYIYIYTPPPLPPYYPPTPLPL
jgi:hypothetical protein